MKLIRTKITQEFEFDLPLSDQQIARRLGVSRQVVWMWRNGKSFPREQHLFKLKEIEKELVEERKRIDEKTRLSAR